MDEQKDLQLETYRKAFEQFDLNGDGSISLKELQIGLREGNSALGDVESKTVGVGTLQALIRSVDINGDNELQFEEFVNLMTSEQWKRITTDESEEFGRQESKRIESAKSVRKIATTLDKAYGQKVTSVENPAYLDRKYTEFEATFRKLPDSKKRAAMEASKKCPELCGDDFKLCFLRCEVFRVKRAVNRYAAYWEKRVETFGARAFGPLDFSCLDADALEVLRNGNMQLTGQRDPDGRLVNFIHFNNSDKLTTKGFLQASWCLTHQLLEDAQAQQKGCVFVMKAVHHPLKLNVTTCKQVADAMRGIIPLRIGAIHYSKPSLPFLINVLKLFLGSDIRKRIIIHSSKKDKKFFEGLAEYGITKEMVPESLGGSFKQDLDKWIESEMAKIQNPVTN